MSTEKGNTNENSKGKRNNYGQTERINIKTQ